MLPTSTIRRSGRRSNGALLLFSFSVAAVGLAGLLWCAVSIVRNELVCAYRIRLIKQIFANSSGSHTRLLLDEFDRVGYQEMVTKFWRPFDSFYPPEFLERVRRRPVPEGEVTVIKHYQ